MGNNVLFLINSLRVGGAEKVFVAQANYLSKKGYNVFFGSVSGKTPSDILVDDLSIGRYAVFFNFKNLFDFEKYRQLNKFIKDNKISLIYSTLDKANIIAKVIRFLKPNIRVIVRESGMADRKSWKTRWFDWVFNFFVDKIIAVSEGVRESLIDFQRNHAGKIVVLRNGVYPLWAEDEVKTRLEGKDDTVIRLLHVASMNDVNKGHFDLIQMAKELKEESKKTKYQLVFAGDGKLRESLEEFVEESGLKDSVIFKGLLGGNELHREYGLANIFVFNSKSEGCPNSVLEAMSFGLPIVAQKSRGLLEVIENGSSGFLMENTNEMKKKIVMFSSNFDLRLKIGLNAYDRVKKNFSFEKQADKLIDILFN